MASSAQSTQGFVDPYDSYNPTEFYNPGTYYGDSGLPAWWMKLFGQDPAKLREGDMALQNQAYERASIQSARAWEEYMDSTAIQRRVKDIEEAGLNPWLAVQNGISGTGTPSVDTGGSAKFSNSSGQSKSNLAMLLLVLAKMFAGK